MNDEWQGLKFSKKDHGDYLTITFRKLKPISEHPCSFLRLEVSVQ